MEISSYSGTIVNGEVWAGSAGLQVSGGYPTPGLSPFEAGRVSTQARNRLHGTADEEVGGMWGVGWLFHNHPELMKAEYLIKKAEAWNGGGERNIYTCQTAEKESAG